MAGAFLLLYNHIFVVKNIYLYYIYNEATKCPTLLQVMGTDSVFRQQALIICLVETPLK